MPNEYKYFLVKDQNDNIVKKIKTRKPSVKVDEGFTLEQLNTEQEFLDAVVFKEYSYFLVKDKDGKFVQRIKADNNNISVQKGYSIVKVNTEQDMYNQQLESEKPKPVIDETTLNTMINDELRELALERLKQKGKI